MRPLLGAKEAAGASQSEHLGKLGRLTALSGGFWGAGLLWHGVESGPAGALQVFAGHGAVSMPGAEIALFAGAIVFGIWQVAPKAWSSARRMSPDMIWKRPKNAVDLNIDHGPLLIHILKSMVLSVGLIVLVLGSILAGWVAPSESAAVGAVGSALLIGLVLIFPAIVTWLPRGSGIMKAVRLPPSARR